MAAGPPPSSRLASSPTAGASKTVSSPSQRPSHWSRVPLGLWSFRLQQAASLPFHGRCRHLTRRLRTCAVQPWLALALVCGSQLASAKPGPKAEYQAKQAVMLVHVMTGKDSPRDGYACICAGRPPLGAQRQASYPSSESSDEPVPLKMQAAAPPQAAQPPKAPSQRPGQPQKPQPAASPPSAPPILQWGSPGGPQVPSGDP